MARVLIVGYGNPMRSDDGLGWHAAVQLFRTAASTEIEVLPCHQLTPDLAEPISRAEAVIFLDITHEGSPGEVHREEIHPAEGAASFSHHLSPQLLLAIVRDLYGAFPHAWLLTICGRCFDPGDTMSADVEKKLPELKAQVRELATELMGSCPIMG